MIAKARKGLQVVRLKSGNPYVFGRGGEEAEALTHASVACEVISSLTVLVLSQHC
jgi:uroporphyrin-III C-methyltransferase/precorrin-2 dehydrogenase/sirohydrochlorin ferrochelatase